MDTDRSLKYHTPPENILGTYEADPLADAPNTGIESSVDFSEGEIEDSPTWETDPLADVPIVDIDLNLNAIDGDLENILSVEANFLVNIPSTTTEPGIAKIQSGDGLTSEPKRHRLKRRKIKAAGAPKMPLTGYVLFINARREQLRSEFPEKSSMEYTRMICEEWKTMSLEKKAPYLEAAEENKERYLKQLNDFFKDRPEVLASELAKSKIRKRNGTSQVNLNKNHPAASVHSPEILETAQITQTNNPTSQPHDGLYDNGGIPIFTKEFLEHNKGVDTELRILRKTKIDFEQQNALLEKHVQTMKAGVENIATENDELEEKNRSLESYLNNLRLKLSQAFSGLALPSEPNGATRENIDKYMNDLCEMATANTNGSASLISAKDIIGKLDLTIPL